MLNISHNSVTHKIDHSRYGTLWLIENKRSGRVLLKLLIAAFIIALITMFLPWTQNIRAKGYVTTLKPDQRAQTIHSVIAGRIEKWYVKEGDFVEKGDTILHISEIKDDYFDPDLLPRTQKQLGVKEMSVSSYMDKGSSPWISRSMHCCRPVN